MSPTPTPTARTAAPEIIFHAGWAAAYRNGQVLVSMGLSGNSQRERERIGRCLTKIVKSENL